MGDSLTALARIDGNWTDIGYAAFLRRFCGSRVDLPASRIFATGGHTTAQIALTWLLPCLIAKPDWCIVEGGINDLLTTLPAPIEASTTIANLKLIYRSLIDAGIFVIAVPIRSTADKDGHANALSPDNRKKQGCINNAIKSFCAANSGITCFDVNPSFINWEDGNALVDLVSDGIHDTPKGAYLVGAGLSAVLNGLIPPRDDRFTLVGDVYDAILNPTGNLLVNGLMKGTTGAPLNGATGQIPDGWYGDAVHMPVGFAKPSYAGYTGLTKASMTLNRTIDPDPLNIPQVVKLFSPADPGWSMEDYVTGEVEAEWDITSGINSIGLTVEAQDGLGRPIEHGDSSDGYDSGIGPWPAGSGSAIFRTSPLKIPANTVYLILVCKVYAANSGPVEAAVNWARASLRKIS
jgi:lysophospholipase L1-like esterase